ncbi:MAG TPA: POTRA domain-containing protein, partial [Tepidisphaeraceae bacterium]
MSPSALQRICVVLLMVGQLVPMPAGLYAQTIPSTGPVSRSDLRGLPVKQVRVLGNTSVSTAVILNSVRTHEGDKFDPDTVQEDYQRIYGLKKFSNVEPKVELT